MSNSPFARNIKAIRIDNGLTQEQLAAKLEVTRQTVVNWENGEVSSPRSKEVTERIGSFFGVTENDLFGISDGYYAKLYGLTDKPANATPVEGMQMTWVPLVGSVHAGKPMDPDDIDGERVQVPQFLVDADADCYACVVEGDCMDRVYPEGCVIVVSPNKPPANGSIAVVRIDGHDAVMRRMYRTKDTLVLSPDSFNDEHEDIVITDETTHSIEWGGKVVWFQSREELD